jgi:hypothetical protein
MACPGRPNEDGNSDVHSIGREDWPIIRRFDLAGGLTFARNELRARYLDAARRSAN